MTTLGKPEHAPSWQRVFGIPLIAGVLTLTGLVSALLWEEIGRYFSWAAVGSPVLIVLWRVAAGFMARGAPRRNG